MANLFAANVLQIDGNPLKTTAYVQFSASNIYIKATTISTIPQVNSAIVCYTIVNNQLQQQTYYVAETVTDLCNMSVTNSANAYNTAMVQVTVLEANGVPLISGGVSFAFPANEIILSDIYPASNIGANATLLFKGVLYSIAEVALTVQQNSNIFYAGGPGPQGVQGPTGPQGPIGPVGPAGLTWKGAWTSGTSYILNDAVGYNGASYFCILATSGTTNPVSDTTHWALLAAQGAQGATGATGAQGPTGPAGVSALSTKKVSLTSAQLKAATIGAPFTLIAAPGAGKVNRVISVMWHYNYGTINYVGGSLNIYYPAGTSSNICSSTIVTTASLNTFAYTSALGTFVDAAAINQVLAISASSILTLGDGTLDLYITYETVTL